MSERLFNFGVSYPGQEKLINDVYSLEPQTSDSISRSQSRSSQRREEQANDDPEQKRERVVFKKKDVPAGKSQVQKRK